MIENQKQYNEELIKHLEKLREVAEKGQPKDLLAKIQRYSRGQFSSAKDKTTNQRNVIRGIIDTKATATLDAQIKPAVVPQTKSMAQAANIITMQDIADVLDDCVKCVLRKNNFDTLRRQTVRDQIKKMAVVETCWDADERDIVIRRIPFTRFFPDPSGSKISECNFIFLEEYYSPITLKAKYPMWADKISQLHQQSNDTQDKNKPGRPITTTIGDQTNQAYTYGDPGSVRRNEKDIKCWKVYLKDDSTFSAEELSTKNEEEKADLTELSLKYPNGRYILYLADSKEIVLDDKPIDYDFGYPLDICFNVQGDSIWECEGDVEHLFEIQDRINNSYMKGKELVGKDGAWIVNDPRNGIKKGDFVNKTVLEIDNKASYGMPEVLTNNTKDKLDILMNWVTMLKQDAMEVARVNEQLVAGTQDEQTTSGEQVKALNESPLSGIRDLQRSYKDFTISIGNKIIKLVQKYYTIAKIIRISEDKYVRIPTKGSGEPIQVMQPGKDEKGSDAMNIIKEIQGDLTIGEYEIEVIAGSERPRSKSENAALFTQLYSNGMLGQGVDAISDLFTELDVPNRRAIIKRLKEQEEQKKPPTIFDNKDLAEMFCKAIPALEGFVGAQQAIIEKAGLPSKQDNLLDAPIQNVAKQSEVKDIIGIVPELVSDSKQKNMQAQQVAQQDQIKKEVIREGKSVGL